MKNSIGFAIGIIVVIAFIIVSSFILLPRPEEDNLELSKQFYKQAFVTFFQGKQDTLQFNVAKSNFINLETREVLSDEAVEEILDFANNTSLTSDQTVHLMDESQTEENAEHYTFTFRHEDTKNFQFVISEHIGEQILVDYWYEALYENGSWNISQISIVSR